MNIERIESLLDRKVDRRKLLATAGLAGVGLTAARLLGPGSAAAAAGIATPFTSRFPGLRPPAAAFDIVQLVQDFPPGSWGGWHTHTGAAYQLVLEGDLHLARLGGIDYDIRAGQYGQCGPGIHTPGNVFGRANMRRLVTALLPSGGPVAAPAAGSFTPGALATTLFTPVRTAATGAPPEFDLVQALVELEPGAFSRPYTLDTVNQWAVVSGRVTVDAAGSKPTYVPGQQFVLPRGVPAVLSVYGSAKAQVVLSALVPIAAQLPSLEAA